jgi:hypothetical protein
MPVARYESHIAAQHGAITRGLPAASGFVRMYVFFDCHVPEFAGFKDVATFLALNEFSIFFAGHNPHARMPAEFLHNGFFGRLVRDK